MPSSTFFCFCIEIFKNISQTGTQFYCDRILLITPWCTVLLEKLTGLQLVKKFPAFHGTRRFITALTSIRHLSLSWASPIQSIYPHPTSWRSILILSTHLRLGLPSGLLPSGFPSDRILYIQIYVCFPPSATTQIHKIQNTERCQGRRSHYPSPTNFNVSDDRRTVIPLYSALQGLRT